MVPKPASLGLEGWGKGEVGEGGGAAGLIDFKQDGPSRKACNARPCSAKLCLPLTEFARQESHLELVGVQLALLNPGRLVLQAGQVAQGLLPGLCRSLLSRLLAAEQSPLLALPQLGMQWLVLGLHQWRLSLYLQQAKHRIRACEACPAQHTQVPHLACRGSSLLCITWGCASACKINLKVEQIERRSWARLLQDAAGHAAADWQAVPLVHAGRKPCTCTALSATKTATHM